MERELFEALKNLLDQLEGIGIPKWHGAEGLDLSMAKGVVEDFYGRMTDEELTEYWRSKP